MGVIAMIRSDEDSIFTDVLADKLGVDKHLELGKQFLAQGQLNDALFHYDEAISKCTGGRRRWNYIVCCAPQREIL